MRSTVRGLVRRANILRGLTPNETVSIGPAHAVFLIVYGPEQGIPCDAREEDGGEEKGTGVGGIKAEILCLESVGRGEEAEATPGQVEAVMIMSDIDSTEVPRLVDEKIQDVDQLEDGDEDQGRIYTTILLILIGDG